METFISAILGVLTGVIATWIFWRTLLLQKPNLAVSDHISVASDSENQKKEYRFKIFNSGKNQITNIKATAWLCDLISVPGGEVARGIHQISLPNSETLTLNPVKRVDRPWGLPPERTLVLQQHPDVNIEEFLSAKNHRIMVVVRYSDAISGTTIVVQKTYSNIDLRSGSFALGESMVIQ